MASVPARQLRRAMQWAAVPAALSAVTFFGHAVGANAITAGFLLIAAVLGLATWGGWAIGAVASVVATLCLNFFFIPPTGTLRVEDPSNWIALACFLGSSALVSRLVARARMEAAEAQRLLRETAHLEAVRESESLKTALLRAVSHDLRTPLTAMRLEIESLERRLERQPEALAALRGLSVEQERLTRRIDNLLALARVEAGAARPQPEPTPPGLLFRAARESLAFILKDRTVEVQIAPDCADLWVDPSLALEVLVNLLENSARAAPPDQTLELAAAQRNGRVRIEVRDRGPGMPAASPGGLGLQIARSLTEASGGSLELVDRSGGGTIARLDLPAAPEPEVGEG